MSAEGQTGDEARRVWMILHYAGSLVPADDIIRRIFGDQVSLPSLSARRRGRVDR